MGGEAQGLPQPPPRGGSVLKWVLGGCGCLLLLAGIGVAAMIALGVGIGGMVASQTEPAAKVAREFLARAGAGDVAGAHATFHERLKEKVPEEQLAEMMESHPELFDVKDSTFNNRSLKDGVARLQGTVVNQEGRTLNCLFKAVEERPGTWRLTAFNITPEPISESD